MTRFVRPPRSSSIRRRKSVKSVGVTTADFSILHEKYLSMSNTSFCNGCRSLSTLSTLNSHILDGFSASSVPKTKRVPKLEIRCRKDGAWYDSDLSLQGDLFRIHFSGFSNNEDEFWKVSSIRPNSAGQLTDKEKVRLRSCQLQDHQCSSVKTGVQVCALRKSEESDMYFDATIVKVKRKPHVAKICDCSFKVQWKEGPLESQRSYLTCRDICLLRVSKKLLSRHPVVKFLNAFANAQDSAQFNRNGNDLEGY